MENFIKKTESTFSPEKKEEVETLVKLYFFRHGKKAGEVLSIEGKKAAREMGLGLNSKKEMAVAGGSFLDRTLESSLRVMMPEEFEDLDSFSEMESKMEGELKVGKKFYRDSRLGFNEGGPIFDNALKAFEDGKYIEWLLNDSDRRAIEKKDLVSSTYLRQAGNIAEILKKYIKVGSNFNGLVKKNDQYQVDNKNEIERYLGTHQGVVECFVLDFLKRKEGVLVAEELATSMGNGWPELGGIFIEIKNKGEESVVMMSYPSLDGIKKIKVEPEVIDEIIKDRELLEKKIKE